MNRIRCILIFCVLLTGCKAQEIKNDVMDGKTTINDLQDEELKKPDETIHNTEEFIYVMDYLAFYRIDEKVFFYIDGAYAEEFYNPYTEYQKAYQMADLADVYACQLDDSYYSKDKIIGLKYSISKDIATSSPQNKAEAKIVPSFDYEQKGDSSYPEENKDREKIHCENTEQLYYLVMNGYEPVPAEGSIAEEVYNEAINVIHTFINHQMDDFEKIKAIYDYLTTEIYYDAETAYSSDTYLVKEQAYYLEGVFLNHCAVCDGKAKAYAMLLNMIGIPCYRTTGVSEDGDHAWNLVQLDNKWYVSCTTYGQSNATKSLNCYLPNYAMLLTDETTPYEEEWGFIPQKHLDIYEILEEEPYDVYEKMHVTVKDMNELIELLNSIEQERPYKAEFMYTGDDAQAFQEEMLTYLEKIENVNAIEVKSERGKVYQIIYLNEEE
ncbi:MAG: hypothetical protein IKR11_13460 [Solobacterium sp.]|nr:hypothetical protein [Solobacterium sp.]